MTALGDEKELLIFSYVLENQNVYDVFMSTDGKFYVRQVGKVNADEVSMNMVIGALLGYNDLFDITSLGDVVKQELKDFIDEAVLVHN